MKTEYPMTKSPRAVAREALRLAREALPVLKDLGIKFARRGGSPEYLYKEGRGFAFEPGRDHRDRSLETLVWLLEFLLLRVHEKPDGRV